MNVGEIHSVIEYFATENDPFSSRSRVSSTGLGGGLGSRLAVRTTANSSLAVRRFVYNVEWDLAQQRLTFRIGPYEPLINIYVHVSTNEEGMTFRCSSDSRHELIVAVCEEMNEVVRSKPMPLLTFIVAVLKVIMEGADEIWPSSDLAWNMSASSFLARALIRDPHSVDFLLLLFHSALASYRRASVCTPIPPELVVNEEPQWDHMISALQAIPSLHTLSPELGVASVASKLSQLPQASLKLLYWLVHSARHLHVQSSLPATPTPTTGARVGLKYPHRVIEVSHSASHEFDALAARYGHFTAYHGSSLENFHSIFRHGLKNLSNTNYMRTGDAFGQGVYVSTDVSVAANFCGYGDVSPQSRWRGQIGCVAVCTVIRHPDVLTSERKDSSDQAAYYVINDDTLLRIEKILVYNDPTAATTTTSTVSGQDTRVVKRWNWFYICLVLYGLLMVAIWAVRTPTYKRLQRRFGSWLVTS